jgi:hypothetical protein
LRVWLTRDALVFRGIIGWGIRRVPYRDIARCCRDDHYRLPKHTICVDKVRWLPGAGVWAYGAGFGNGLGSMHWDTLTTWHGVSLRTARDRSLFIEMPDPDGFLRAIAKEGVTVLPGSREPGGVR